MDSIGFTPHQLSICWSQTSSFFQEQGEPHTQGKESSTLLYKKTPYKKQIEALSQIGKAISSDQYLDDILKLIVTVTANVMDSKICSLWVLDDKEKVLKIRATQTMSEEYLKERSLKLAKESSVTWLSKTSPWRSWMS